MMNEMETHLNTYTDTHATLNFVVYVPPANQVPLKLKVIRFCCTNLKPIQKGSVSKEILSLCWALACDVNLIHGFVLSRVFHFTDLFPLFLIIFLLKFLQN